MRRKIAFLGAGSYVFARNVIRDILTFPAFEDCTLALMDINPERLAMAQTCVDTLLDVMGRKGIIVEATTDRRRALAGADGVVSALRVGAFDTWRRDIEIPEAYGVDLVVGDTRGPAAIFRALRSIPVMRSICKDIREICPDAVFLNYTNPMGLLCGAMRYEKVNVIGLCHSVWETANMLAGWIGAPVDEITYTCAGINHMAWFLDFHWNGEDALPLIRKAVARPEIYEQEIVRNEMFKHFGYYITESSGHCSEYVPWIRKRPGLIEKYCLRGKSDNPGIHALSVKSYTERQQTWKAEFAKFAKSPVLERGSEYAAYVLNAMIGDGTPFTCNVNIPNDCLIDNIPGDCCVEVPAMVSREGLQPFRIGKLPTEVAVITSQNAMCEALAVEGALTSDPRKIYAACYCDPLTSAVLSLDEIHSMVRQMFEENKEYLENFTQFE